MIKKLQWGEGGRGWVRGLGRGLVDEIHECVGGSCIMPAPLHLTPRVI
jgi:hypothetical protein